MPLGFIVTVVSKLRFVKEVLYGTEVGPKRAFNRLWVGLKSEEDVEEFKTYLDQIRTEVVGSEFSHVIEGESWKLSQVKSGASTPNASEGSNTLRHEQLLTESTEASDDVDDAAGAEQQAADRVDEAAADTYTDEYYGKFDQGFEGTFADMSDFFGGLESMIGDCRKDLIAAMEEEHYTVLNGFGGSDTVFSTTSYRVVTTPRKEWEFVVHPTNVGDMSAGIDRETGQSRGNRTKVDIAELHLDAATLITASFEELGLNLVITPDEIINLQLLPEEIIAMRLYTGPCFELYNAVLRAWGTLPGSARGFVPAHSAIYPGEDVRDRFTTTLHVLNSGVLKISRLQPAMQVYRGISRMKLPRQFTEPDQYNVRGGVEYGFMSTTTDESIAMTFAKDGDTSTASSLVVAKMGNSQL